ncbi:MAG: hypothetical protein ACM3JQ_05810 [Candidatus Eiseniibacteriota bacterium]
MAGNNVLRLVPDDTHQAQAVSQQMWSDGVRVIVPFWRTDVRNDSNNSYRKCCNSYRKC